MKRNIYISIVFFTVFTHTIFGQVDSTIAPYNYKNLGSLINSELAELNPIVSADETILFFTREEKGKYFTKQYIWSSERDANNNWTEAKKESKPFNTMPINSVADILHDGKTVLLKGNYRNNGIHARGFSLVDKVNGEWTKPVGLHIDEYESLDKGLFNNATISFDKRVLIFSFSETEGGKDNNLYISFQKEGISYSKPVKLPSPLNMEGYFEFAPRISADAKKIYFSSDRADGLGSNDIYMSERLDESWMKWSKAENLGNVVNTSGRDSYFSIDSLGQFAYIVSDMNSLGRSDIFQVKLKSPHTISGLLVDQRTNKKLSGTVEILTPASKDLIAVNDGAYEKRYNTEGQFIVKSSAEGYYERIDTIELKRHDKVINLDLALQKKPLQRKVRVNVKEDGGKLVLARITIADRDEIFVQEDMKTAGMFETMLSENRSYTVTATEIEEQNKISKLLEVPHVEEGDSSVPTIDIIFKAHQIFNFINLYFKTNSAIPEDSSYKFMDMIAGYMLKHPDKKIEISAHTDDVGSNAKNLDLSKRRAETVKKYIISKGIDEARLKSTGHGENKPVQTGKSEEARALNRRVEFELLE